MSHYNGFVTLNLESINKLQSLLITKAHNQKFYRHFEKFVESKSPNDRACGILGNYLNGFYNGSLAHIINLHLINNASDKDYIDNFTQTLKDAFVYFKVD